MKSLITLTLLLVTAGYLYLTRDLTFPHETSITDKQGRNIAVTLLGRSDSYVQFSKQGELKIYEVPYSRLSEKHLQFLQRFPYSPVKLSTEEPTPLEDKWVTSKRGALYFRK